MTEPARWRAALAAATVGLLGALLVAGLLSLLLLWISVDQPLEPRELIDWGLRWGGVLAVALASGAALGDRPPARPQAAIRGMAILAAVFLSLCLLSMGLAVLSLRLGLWAASWELSNRSAYAAQITGMWTAEWLGLPAAALGGWWLWRLRLPAPPFPRRPWRAPRGNSDKLDAITRVLVLAMILAVILNGLPFWSRRVGLVDRQAYARDVALFCRPPVQPLWLPATCRPHRFHRLAPGEDPSQPQGGFQRIRSDRLHQMTALDAGLKSLRYGVIVLLLAGSAALQSHRGRPTLQLRGIRPWLPLLPLMVSSLVSAGISLSLDGVFATLRSALWCLWIPLAALAGWLTTPRRLGMLADGAAALVWIQLPFLVLEAARGLPLPFGGPAVPWLPTRLSGLLNQPNTLGGFLAISVALAVCVGHRRWHRWPLLLVSLGISLLARSGAGVVGLALVAIHLLAGEGPGRGKRWLALVVLLLPLSLLLPQLLGRPQLLDSPGGRIRTVRTWLQQPHTPREWLLGNGLASPDEIRGPITKAATPPRGPSADDMPSMLLSQGGLGGLVAFYGFLGWCLWRDPPWRLFWLVVLATSLTLRLTEVFPLGLWMAVAAARWADGGRGPKVRSTAARMNPSP